MILLKHSQRKNSAINLRAGDIVDVLNENEILATLDDKGTLDGLAFMPEMRKYCGKRFKVLKHVEKIISESTGEMRRAKNTVILEGANCDGQYHGKCQRTCPLLWKENWLKRV